MRYFQLKLLKSKQNNRIIHDKAKKKKLLCCPSPRPTVNAKKQGQFFFFFFFMSDLGEEFAKICIQWLKKALAWLVYAFQTAFPPEFSPFRNLKKKLLENSTLSRYVKKKKKKKKIPTDRPNFHILVRWGQH